MFIEKFQEALLRNLPGSKGTLAPRIDCENDSTGGRRVARTCGFATSLALAFETATRIAVSYMFVCEAKVPPDTKAAVTCRRSDCLRSCQLGSTGCGAVPIKSTVGRICHGVRSQGAPVTRYAIGPLRRYLLKRTFARNCQLAKLGLMSLLDHHG